MKQDTSGAICCVVGWWPGPNDSTGIFIREHVSAIALNRRVVVIYVEVVKKGWLNFSTRSHIAMEEGIEVHRVRITTPVRRSGAAEALVRRAYRNFFREQRRKFDLIHIHVRTEVTEQVTPMAREMGLPVVLTEHNTFYHTGIRKLHEPLQSEERDAIRRWLSDPCIRRVMPVSNDLAQVLQEDFGVEKERIIVVPNVAADAFRPGSGSTSPPFRLLLAAVWRPPKDPDVFIKALKALPPGIARQCSIDWAGYGPSMPHIMERCKAELPALDIRFTGRLGKSELAALMQRAHFFVLPTTAENLPCVILESLCCGTPVISMAVNGVPELINDGNGILVPPSDPVALSDALLKALGQVPRFDRDSIARSAISRFSKVAVGKLIEGIYRSVLQVHEVGPKGIPTTASRKN